MSLLRVAQAKSSFAAKSTPPRVTRMDRPAAIQMPRPGLLPLLLLCALGLAACSEPQRPTISLDRAVDIGDLDQVKRHLHWGSDVNRPDAHGHRPLHVAARAGRIAIARQLVRHGAELEARDATGDTPLAAALMHGRTQLAEMLIHQGAAFDAQGLLEILIRRGLSDRDTLELLIERGADLDARDQDGLAPIHRAVRQGDLVLATRLIRAGIDIDRPDAMGRTALDLAIASDARDLVKLLQQYGARPADHMTRRPAQPSPATTEPEQ